MDGKERENAVAAERLVVICKAKEKALVAKTALEDAKQVAKLRKDDYDLAVAEMMAEIPGEGEDMGLFNQTTGAEDES